jgi:ribosomal protein S1
MSEGTRIGEYKESAESLPTVSPENKEASSDFAATKIGEMSEFERSLMAFEESSDKDSQFADVMDRILVDFQEGDIIKGSVRSIEKAGVLLDISYKSDGFIANSEFSFDYDETPSSVLKPGDKVNVMIVKLESKEGYTVLSRKRAEYELAWGRLSKLAKTKETVLVRVTSSVQGGLVVSYSGIKGFIPASQVAKEGENDLSASLNQLLEVVVVQVDRKRRKVIFSNRVSKAKMNREEAQKLLESLESGQVKEGRVTSIKDFGVFVDIGGVEGLVHISELSWSRVSHASELVKVGDEVRVFVLGVDKEAKRVSLGMKQLEADPWVKVSDRYQVGQIVEGEITRIATFGSFMRLENNLEGLIHISELAHNHIERVEDVVKVGDKVKAKIIKLVPEEQRIGLSLKAIEAKDIAKPESAVSE